ncbi:MAG: hypothetical protein U5K37_03960 [Natrialbaceae archaeon]|nr:hypothetical protein [Natrialbaceae archaeon]
MTLSNDNLVVADFNICIGLRIWVFFVDGSGTRRIGWVLFVEPLAFDACLRGVTAW